MEKLFFCKKKSRKSHTLTSREASSNNVRGTLAEKNPGQTGRPAERERAKRGSEGEEGEASWREEREREKLGEIFTEDLEAETGKVRVETVRGALENRPRVFPAKG